MISWVRIYKFYNTMCYDVLYKSNRLCSGDVENMPKTIKAFISSHDPVTEYNKVYKREETLYKEG